MTVQKVGNRWAVVKKDGSLGKGRFTSSANAQKAQARGRKLSKGNPSPARKSNPSTGSSTSSGGGGSSTVKHGLLYRRLRTLLNLTAPAWGEVEHGGPTRTLEQRVASVTERVSGYDFIDGSFDIGRAVPAWQGWGVSLANDWLDRKLRNSSKMSRGKFFNNLVELIPMLRARMEVPPGRTHRLYSAAVNWNKKTTGYDPNGGSWRLDRVEEYAFTKGLVAVYDTFVPADWKATANRVLPKGLNPF